MGRAWLAPVVIAAFSASLMLIVATVEGLPLRDPDARYVGSPLALIGVIAGIFLVLDLIPRSWRRSRETRHLASGVVRRRLRGALVGPPRPRS